MLMDAPLLMKDETASFFFISLFQSDYHGCEVLAGLLGCLHEGFSEVFPLPPARDVFPPAGRVCADGCFRGLSWGGVFVGSGGPSPSFP